jgi:hypothetical protein
MYEKLLEDMGMYQGMIITPQNVQKILKNSTAFEKIGYGLVGYMSKDMRKKIKDNPDKTGCRFTFFESYKKELFFVVVIQAGTSQSRFLTHLRDKNVLKMLDWCAKKGFLQIALTVHGEIGCFNFRPEFSLADIEPILKLNSRLKNISGSHLVREMAIAATELKENTEILSCEDMPAVDDVCVNSIL